MVKYIELACLFLLTIWIGKVSLDYIYDILFFYDNPYGEDSAMHLIVAGLLGVTGLLAVFNLLFNNLLMNIRFNTKMKCYTCGFCIFDVINYIQCKSCLYTLCRDRCF